MRSQKDVDNSNRHNETKTKVLHLLMKAKRYMTTPQIAKECNLTKNNASMQMKKLAGQGYIWRKEVDGNYYYQYLKPMGHRVSKELWVRMRLKEQMNDFRITLNLKRKIPPEHEKLYQQLSKEYYQWLFER